MASHIIASLQNGEPVIAGLMFKDESGKVAGAHTINIIGAGDGPAGELLFACNDSQNGSDEPFYVSADELLPKIHHANYANGIAQMPEKNEATTYALIPYYKEELLG